MSEIRSCQFASWSETYQITDPKEIWNKIDWKGNRGNRDIFNYRPEIEDLGNRKIQPQMKMFLVSSIEYCASTHWVPGMVNEVNIVLFPLLLILFNIMLQHSIFPTKWLFCVVVALFKNNGSS